MDFFSFEIFQDRENFLANWGIPVRFLASSFPLLPSTLPGMHLMAEISEDPSAPVPSPPKMDFRFGRVTGAKLLPGASINSIPPQSELAGGGRLDEFSVPTTKRNSRSLNPGQRPQSSFLAPSPPTTTRSDLERKMELLEARFVSPHPAPGVQHHNQRDPRIGDAAADGGSNLLLPHHLGSGSHHSFSFDEPRTAAGGQQRGVGGQIPQAGSDDEHRSLSRSTSLSTSRGGGSRRSRGGGGSGSSAAALPPQGPPLIQTQSYREANLAAERHMARVGAELGIRPHTPSQPRSGAGEDSRASLGSTTSSLGSRSAASASDRPSAASAALPPRRNRKRSVAAIAGGSSGVPVPASGCLRDADGGGNRDPGRTPGNGGDGPLPIPSGG